MRYKIDSDKLEKVVEIFNREIDPAATDEVIEAEICSAWNEAEGWQEWIDRATAQEIADRLASRVDFG